MITREKEPPNLEMPFGALDGIITPTDLFYIRCHFPIPQINEAEWRLKIEGAVKEPIDFSLAQLRDLANHTITATMECAGNGRVFLVPKVKGVQWELGAVGNASWTGVLLRDVLEKTGIRNGACEIILEGADNGAIAEPPRPAGTIHYARSVPVEKAMDDTLLAYQMNGQSLPPAHGFPLRAVVPGWYGMASVKWLQRIIVSDQCFNGYYQSVDYAYWHRGESGPTLVPLTEMRLKAQIAHPEGGETIRKGANCRVKGAAWGGNAEVAKVELTTDGGKSWREARLQGEASKNVWRLWELDWEPMVPGKHVLMARATDSRGNVQGMERNADAGTYMITHCLPIEVEVC